MSETTQAIQEALVELTATVESKSADSSAYSSENREKIEKINTVLEAQEVKNQELVKELGEKNKAELELKDRIDGLETHLAHQKKSDGNYTDLPQYKALNAYMQRGDSISPEEKQLLRTDNDVEGGYLVNDPEFDNAITKKITEVSNIRSVARVRTIGNKSLEIPVRDTLVGAQYEGEAEEDETDTSTYSNETLTAFAQSVTIPVTKDLLMDSAFNMESEILSDAGESFAQNEGLNFVGGDGVKKPFGFLADARTIAAKFDTAASGVLDATDMILVTGELKTGYNPWYIMNRRTLAFLRTLKSTTGSFLWQPGMNGPVANTINGFPYLIAEDMPDIAAGAFPVVFADLARGYTIVDRTGMSVVRDELTQKRKRIVEFTINRWNTGKVTLPEAIKLLRVAP